MELNPVEAYDGEENEKDDKEELTVDQVDQKLWKMKKKVSLLFSLLFSLFSHSLFKIL